MAAGRLLSGAFDHLPLQVRTGASWSTAAPLRVPTSAFARTGVDVGAIACVDTDAAALDESRAAGSCTVVCLAHLDEVTVTAGVEVGWGPGMGADALLAIGLAAVAALTRPDGARTPAPAATGP